MAAAASSPSSPAPATPAGSTASSLAPGPLSVSAGSTLGAGHVGPFTHATKTPALGQAVTWQFVGGTALAGATIEVLASDRDYPVDFRPVTTVTADATGTAFYTVAFDHPAYLSVRASVPASATHAAGLSPSSIASWRGTGACPVQVSGPPDQALGPPTLVSGLGGATYTLQGGWDRAGDAQSTLSARATTGSAGRWTYVFAACDAPAPPVVAADGSVYVWVANPRHTFTSGRLFVFGAAGLRAVRAESGLRGGPLRAPDGSVYLVAQEETARPGSSWAGIWHASYLAALDAAGRPRAGWPYVSDVPLSDPSFGPHGTLYLAAGFQIGWPDVPASAARVHAVIALRPDGSLVPGWPFALPAGTAAAATWTSEGMDMVYPQPPAVGADGSVYVVATKGTWGQSPAGNGDLVFALDPNGQVKAGWPYAIALARGGFVVATGGGPGATPPAIGPDGTVYLLHLVGTLQSGHDEILALGPGGRIRRGWPAALPDRVDPTPAACPPSAGSYLGCWLRRASDGQLVIDVSGPPPDVTTPLCLAPTGRRVTCSDAAASATVLP